MRSPAVLLAIPCILVPGPCSEHLERPVEYDFSDYDEGAEPSTIWDDTQPEPGEDAWAWEICREFDELERREVWGRDVEYFHESPEAQEALRDFVLDLNEHAARAPESAGRLAHAPLYYMHCAQIAYAASSCSWEAPLPVHGIVTLTRRILEKGRPLNWYLMSGVLKTLAENERLVWDHDAFREFGSLHLARAYRRYAAELEPDDFENRHIWLVYRGIHKRSAVYWPKARNCVDCLIELVADARRSLERARMHWYGGEERAHPLPSLNHLEKTIAHLDPWMDFARCEDCVARN